MNRLHAEEKGCLCFRIDDVHPQMDWDRFIRFMNLMDEYKIHPLLGVIPDCKDISICRSKTKTNFWEIIRNFQDRGIPIAMHGYDHAYITKEAGIFPINNRSEFAGLDIKLQEEKIAKGREELEKKGIIPIIFMAPAHSFDDMTIDVLVKHNFKYITDGFSKKPYRKRNMIFIPVSLNIRDAEKKLSKGITTLVIHTDTMDELLFERYKAICEMHKDSLVSYEKVMNLETGVYDAGYEKRKAAIYHGTKRICGAVKKVLKR